MQATITKEKIYTFEEYLEFEEQSPYKYEFQNGKLVPIPIGMSGGTLNHVAIIGSLYFYLKIALKKLSIKSRIDPSDTRIFIDAINESVYPDCTIVLGEVETYKRNQGIKNPTIICEVLSNSTGNYDRGKKFRKYKNLPSFREYVLVEQDSPAIDVVYKNDNGVWEISSFVGLDEVLKLNTIDIEIPLSKIYEDAIGLELPQMKMDLE